MPRIRRLIPALSLLALAPAAAGAQSLRGSPESVEKMYDAAVREGFSFYQDAEGVRQARSSGELVTLAGDNFETHRIAYPYVRPATLAFVQRLAERYESACGEPMVVTSAVRPENRQPRNSSDLSVHPTGMAVDLRRPEGHCLAWLRHELLTLEGEGSIEATEEHHPAHFHVAVLDDSFESMGMIAPRYALSQVARVDAPAPRTASRGSAKRGATPRATSRVRSSAKVATARRGAAKKAAPRAAHSYVVRPGDSLWSIAMANDATVASLRRANRLAGPRIVVGQRITLP